MAVIATITAEIMGGRRERLRVSVKSCVQQMEKE